MQYRRFGKTNLNLSVLTLGLMRYMSDDPEASAAVVRRAVELGINHLETAYDYGTSEQLLGHALKSIDRKSVYITTKMQPKPTYDQFMQCFEESMGRMGLDYLDKFDVHGINNDRKFRMAVDEKENWRAIRKLMDAGTIGHVGFSTHGKTPLLLQAIDTGRFESINLHHYWFYQVNEPAVARAAELDMGVFIISPNDKGGLLQRPSEKLQRLSSPLHPMTLNARWLLSDPRVHTLSIGAAQPSDLDLHLQAVDHPTALDAEERAALQRWAEEYHQANGADFCTQCQDCLPCPLRIDIPEILRLRNIANAFEMREYGSYRYNLLDGSDDWFHGPPGDHCTECGQCLSRCPEKLDIPRLLFDAHDHLKTATGRRLWQ